MLEIIASLVPIFGIIFIGAIVERLRLLPSTTVLCLNQFVYWIGLPALLFSQLASFDPSEISQDTVLGILSGLILSFIAAYLVARLLLRKTKQESTILGLLGSFSNSAFMGLSMIALFLPGNQPALMAATVFTVLANITFLFADANLELATHQGEKRIEAFKSLAKAFCKNPILLSAVFGFLASFTVTLPKTLLVLVKMLAATASPLALFCMGMILSLQLASAEGFTRSRMIRHMPVHITKLVIQPVITYCCLLLFGIDGIVLNVATMVSAMPTGVSAYVIAEKYHISIEDSSIIVFMNSVFSIITIPLTVIILHAINGFAQL